MSAIEETRIERDSMGEMQVPANAYYGASTHRAVLNFPISDLRFPRQFILQYFVFRGIRDEDVNWHCMASFAV